MAQRNPNIPQLDFPQLVADIIQQLNLTGTVGLLDFLDAVRPVYIVASREGALAFTASSPLFTSAGITSGTANNPLTNAIIADTGPLAAGDYDIFANMAMVNQATLGPFELQHRNAANTATLAVLLFLNVQAINTDTTSALPLIGYTVALNERFRFQYLGGNSAAVLSAVIGLQIRPTP